MTSDHPTVQLVLRPGILDLGWGHPDPALLPLEGMRSAATEAIDRFGTDALAYGYAAGAGPLIGWLRARIAATEGRDPGREGITITGGSSLGLDQICKFRRGEVPVVFANDRFILVIKIFLHTLKVQVNPFTVNSKDQVRNSAKQSPGILFTFMKRLF